MVRKPKEHYGSEDIYKYYKRITKNPHNLTQADMGKILKDFFTGVTDLMIYKGIEFTMPYRLGSVRIKKAPVKYKLNGIGRVDVRRLRPNWGACRKLWAKDYPNKTWEEIVAIPNKSMIYHENKHTDRFNFSWRWDRLTCAVSNSQAYKINFSRANDRKLAKALKDEELDLDFARYQSDYINNR